MEDEILIAIIKEMIAANEMGFSEAKEEIKQWEQIIKTIELEIKRLENIVENEYDCSRSRKSERCGMPY